MMVSFVRCLGVATVMFGLMGGVQAQPAGQMKLDHAIRDKAAIKTYSDSKGKTPSKVFQPGELTYPVAVLESADGMARIRVGGQDYWVDASEFMVRRDVAAGCLYSPTRADAGTSRGANENCVHK